MAKGADCSSRGPWFDSQHPQSRSQLELQSQGIHCPLLASLGTECKRCTDTHADKTLIQIKQNERKPDGKGTDSILSHCACISELLSSHDLVKDVLAAPFNMLEPAAKLSTQQ